MPRLHRTAGGSARRARRWHTGAVPEVRSNRHEKAIRVARERRTVPCCTAATADEGVVTLEFASERAWVPRELDPVLPSRTAHNWQAVGRLREGVSLGQAQTEVTAIAGALTGRTHRA